MRSRAKFRVTAAEVHSHAQTWTEPLKLKSHGPKCTKSVILSILFVAASRICSIYAACRDLAYAPSDQALRDALMATLPKIATLEKRLNAALCVELPKILKRKARDVAMDLTLIPYHGKPEEDEHELYHSAPKSGTTKFHAYATAYVMHNGFRYTLALTRVSQGEKMPEVVQRLLKIVRARGIRVKLLLLDRGFFSTAVVAYLKRARVPFLMPVIVRGKKSPATGLRVFLKKPNGWYRYTMTDKNKKCQERVRICVARKSYRHRKKAKKQSKSLLYAAWQYRGDPTETYERYRKRFGIESSYRQMHQARIRTCTRSPLLRLLFFGLALILRNVWVWLHYTLFADSRGEEPTLHLERLRFRRMLRWLQHVAENLLHNGETFFVEWQP